MKASPVLECGVRGALSCLAVRKMAFFSILCCLLAACGTTRVTPKPGQKVVYSSGCPAIISKGRSSEVAVEPIGKDKDGRLLFSVLIVNSGKTAFNFGLENVTAFNGAGKPLRLYSREDVERHARVKAAWRKAAIAMSAAGESMSASLPTQTSYNGTYSGNSTYSVQNPSGQRVGTLYGNTTGYTSGTITTYNPAATIAAQQAINANTDANVRATNSLLQDEMAAAQGMLATTTICPKSMYSGLVCVRYSRDVDLRLIALGDEHHAAFDVK